MPADEFQRRFSPSSAETEAVARWLLREGFTVTGFANVLSFNGSVATAHSAMAVKIAKFGNGSVCPKTSAPVIPGRFACNYRLVEGMDDMAHAVAMNAQSDSVASLPEAIVNGARAFELNDLRTFYDQTPCASELQPRLSCTEAAKPKISLGF